MALMPAGSPSVLDNAPPAPDPASGLPGRQGPGGPSGPMSMRGAEPIYPPGTLPPEVMQTIQQAGASTIKTLDLIAQTIPQVAPDVDLAKRVLEQLFRKVTALGAGGGTAAISSTEPGQNFPGASTPLGPSGAAPSGPVGAMIG